MLKKYAYHGSFALLGVSLLLGMAILQANGLKTSENLSVPTEPAHTTPTLDDDNTMAEAAPKEEVQLAQLPAPVAPIPAPVALAPIKSHVARSQKAIAPAIKKMAPAVVKIPPEVIKDIPLDNVQSFAIYDSHRKPTTRKTFAVTPNGLRKALAYYRQLSSRYGKPATVQAELPDATWATISAKSFHQYVVKNIDE